MPGCFRQTHQSEPIGPTCRGSFAKPCRSAVITALCVSQVPHS